MLGPRALVAALVSVLAAAPALAQPRSSNRPPQDVANDLVKQAISKSQQGDHMGAIDLYLSAYSLIPQYTLLSNIGNEYQQAGKPVEALKYFCMYLDKDPTGVNATYANSKAKALQIELGNKDVDDKTVCKPPKKDRETPPPNDETVKDGLTGTHDLDKTTHVEKNGTAGGGGSGGTLKTAGLAVGGAGLIAVGFGVYYGMKAQDRSDFISNHDPMEKWPDNIRQIEQDGQTFETRQIYLSIAGGALTATGAVLFILGATRTSSPEKLSVRPTMTGTSAGLAVGGGF